MLESKPPRDSRSGYRRNVERGEGASSALLTPQKPFQRFPLCLRKLTAKSCLESNPSCRIHAEPRHMTNAKHGSPVLFFIRLPPLRVYVCCSSTGVVLLIGRLQWDHAARCPGTLIGIETTPSISLSRRHVWPLAQRISNHQTARLLTDTSAADLKLRAEVRQRPPPPDNETTPIYGVSAASAPRA